MSDASCVGSKGRVYPSLPGDTGSAYDAPFMTSRRAPKSTHPRELNVAERVIPSEEGKLRMVRGRHPRAEPILSPRQPMNKVARGSLLGTEKLEAPEIIKILQLARRMNPQKPRPLLRGKRVVLLFYEPSTRTRSSFEVAAKSMGAMTTLVQSSGSSIEKGESLLDTGYTLRAVGADIIVIRHPLAGAPHLMAQHLDIPVINAGDGMHEHPSQALLDAYTILRHKKNFKGLHVSIVGDIFHSRVARSACHLHYA